MQHNICKDCGGVCYYKSIRCRKCNNKLPKRTGPRSQTTKDKISKSLMGHTPWNKGIRLHYRIWNKGKTKKTDPRILKIAINLSKVLKGRPITYAITDKHKEASRKRMLGNANPAKRPEVREKIRKSVLKMYVDHPEILENRRSSGINQYSNSYTSIEKSIADVLSTLSLPFIHNYRIGRYFVDFLVLDNIILECDGEYWHQDTDKEARREKYLHDNEYYTFHFLGNRILKNPFECISTMVGVMTELGHREIAKFYTQTLPWEE